MSPTVRRIVYVILYETFALILATSGLLALGHDLSLSGVTAIVSSVVAMSWNFVWTSVFERWELRQVSRTRTVRRRVVHALGFEAGLLVLLVPTMAFTLKVGLLEAFLLDIGLMIFFLVYTFVFAWVFDLVFPPHVPPTPVAEA